MYFYDQVKKIKFIPSCPPLVIYEQQNQTSSKTKTKELIFTKNDEIITIWMTFRYYHFNEFKALWCYFGKIDLK